MSAEALSGVGQAVGSAGAMATESVSPVAAAAPSLGESIGSLGSFAPESMPTDFSVFEKAFAPASPSAIDNDAFIPSLNNDIFSNTIEFKPQPQVLEQPATLDSLKNMEVVWSAKDQPSPTALLQKPEASILNISDIVLDSAEINTIQSDLEIPTDLQIPEDIMSSSEAFLETAQTLELDLLDHKESFVSSIIDRAESNVQQDIIQDAQIAGKVETLLEEIGFSQNDAIIIATRSFEEAVVKKGIELKPEIESQTQPLARTATQIENEIVAQEETKPPLAKSEENKTKSKNKKRPEEVVIFVKDEEANEERRKDAQQAINKTFSKDEEKDGTEIVSKMNATPTAKETSEIVRKITGNVDGSYEEVLEDIRAKRFSSKKEAEEIVDSVINQKTAVKLEESGRVVSDKDIKRVLKANYSMIT